MAEDVRRGIGFAEGRHKGQPLGLVEGHNLGFDHGSSLGRELGFYTGYAKMTQILLEDKETKPRLQQCLTALNDMISSCSMDDTYNTLFDKLGKVRAKYKQLTSLMGVSTECKSVSEISF